MNGLKKNSMGANILNQLRSQLLEHQNVMAQLENILPLIEKTAELIISAITSGGKVFFMGNGGSAADSQHLAAELIGRFKIARRALPAIALTTDSSILTCISNDDDYSFIFSRQIEGLCRPGDVVFGISTSGNSKNVIHGIETAKKLDVVTIGMTGKSGGQLATIVEHCFQIPSNTVSRIQEAHIFIGHCICELVENHFATDEYKLVVQG